MSDFESLISPAGILRINGDKLQEETLVDPVIREGRMLVYVNGKLLLDSPALPEASEPFALGALFLDGLIDAESASRHAAHLRVSQGGTRIDVDLPGVSNFKPVLESLDCFAGKTLLEGDADKLPMPAEGGFTVSSSSILDAVGALSREPSLYRLTGGVHSAGWALSDGSLSIRYEDISRRSAVDKVIGTAVLKGLAGMQEQAEGFLVSSGRISSDIVARAAKARFPLIASVSAPTDRALEIARLWGITLCGFVRGRKMNVYTHQERVIRDTISA